MSSQDPTTSSQIQIDYAVDTSVHPSAWPGANLSGYVAVYKVDIIFININHDSDFRIIRTGTNDTVHKALIQVTKHIARGLYSIVSLNASNHSCVVVMSTDKSREELIWKNGFPWDTERDPQPKIEL